MNEIRRIAAVKTVPVDFPIPGVEVNKPVEPQVIETVELELYGETYPEPVRVENPKLPKCWPNKTTIKIHHKNRSIQTKGS